MIGKEIFMNRITISEDTVSIQIQGLDKVWSFKGSLTIPRDSITKAYRYERKLKPPGFRFPGTMIPRLIISGTYYGQNRKEFWNHHFNKEAIVLDLKNIEYTRIVVDFDDPDAVLSELEKD